MSQQDAVTVVCNRCAAHGATASTAGAARAAGYATGWTAALLAPAMVIRDLCPPCSTRLIQ